MGRMHCNGKGISRSSLPFHRGRPSWVRKEIKDVEVRSMWNSFNRFGLYVIYVLGKCKNFEDVVINIL